MIDSVYFKYLNENQPDRIVDLFHETIIDTNRNHKFFVNWDKVKKNVSKYQIEFNILNTLIGNKNFDIALRNLLNKYPEIIQCFPILIAVRDLRLKVINDFLSPDSHIVEYNFRPRNLSPKEIDKFIGFFEKTGLKDFFLNLSSRSIQDYVTGIEVGLDTNARKNRSGTAMESLLNPIINQISEKLRFKAVLYQKSFGSLEDRFGVSVSPHLRNRKADFIILKNNYKIINIEANFYSGTGSKPQEIVDSYINRQRELEENRIKFIWITDGFGWKGQKNQIRKGFELIDYVLNIFFVREGLLEGILLEV